MTPAAVLTDAESSTTVYQPLDPEIRQVLDPELAAFHDRYLQYVEPDDVRPWDAVKTRSRRPYPSGTSEPVSVSRIKNIKLKNFPVRVFWPHGQRPSNGWPALVWYHGGGWALGSIESENDFCTRMCIDADCVVITVGYRLAPEHPYPIPVEDSLAAMMWVQSVEGRHELGIDHHRIAVGGTSAGGNLSVVVALKSSLLPESVPIVFQLLIVPVIDNTATTTTVWASRAKAPWLTPARMLWYRRMYLPDIGCEREWEASPNLAPDKLLSRTPNTWMAIAEQDLLAPEAIAFSENLRRLDVDVEVEMYPGMTHTILAMNGVLTMGKKLVNDCGHALRAAFERSKPSVQCKDDHIV